jgi:hypothetical protein
MPGESYASPGAGPEVSGAANSADSNGPMWFTQGCGGYSRRLEGQDPSILMTLPECRNCVFTNPHMYVQGASPKGRRANTREGGAEGVKQEV